MAFEVLYDLHNEINRIFIAGSKFSKDDPRIKKLIPSLIKLGEKVPVINKIKEETEKLVNSDLESSSNNLYCLSILLYSVLNSLADTTIESEKKQIERFKNEDIITKLPFSTYQRIKNILTGKEQADYNFLEYALKNNFFDDYRLVPYIFKALESKNYYLIEYIYNNILMYLGEKSIPYLIESLDLNSNKKSDSLKLETIYKINPKYNIEVALKALEEGKEELKISAINILTKPEYESLLIKYLNDKKLKIKQAVFCSLSKLGNLDWLKEGYKLLDSEKYDVVLESFKNLNNEEVFEEIILKIIDLYEKTIKHEDQNIIYSNCVKLNNLIIILFNKNNDGKLYDFIFKYFSNEKLLKNIFKQKNYYNYEFINTFNFILESVSKMEDIKYIENLSKLKNLNTNVKLDSCIFHYFRRFALDNTKEEIYENFYQDFYNNKIENEKFMIGICNNDDINFYDYYNLSDEKKELINNAFVDKVDRRFIPIIFDKLAKNKNNFYNYETILLNTTFNFLNKNNEKEIMYLINFLKETSDSKVAFPINLYKEMILNDYLELVPILIKLCENINLNILDNNIYVLDDVKFFEKISKNYKEDFEKLHSLRKNEVILKIIDYKQ